jgi:hypothetical protein
MKGGLFNPERGKKSYKEFSPSKNFLNTLWQRG